MLASPSVSLHRHLETSAITNNFPHEDIQPPFKTFRSLNSAGPGY